MVVVVRVVSRVVVEKCGGWVAIMGWWGLGGGGRYW